MGSILSVRDLSKHFRVSKRGLVKAVDGVSFDIEQGEILGLVGESGCGKTTLGRTIKRIYEPDGGRIVFEGRDIAHAGKDELRAYARRAQMIFQDPYSSLDPRMTVAEIVGEGMAIHKLYGPGRIRERTIELLELVGLNSEHASRFPHEFSGGQRQRVGIARALALEPRFLVCDEPISALDVSIQAQIVNLFKRLRDRLELTYLFVAHDLAMVRYIADRVAVMYLGRIVEVAGSDELYRNPAHPYTELLLSAIPIPDPRVEAGREAPGQVPEMASPLEPREGCSFSGRCAYAGEGCATRGGELFELSPGHYVACDAAAKRRR
ncbi:MAG TPA: ABC transporter ATP-binding protein [Spirochaetales bacterium]|nr:ABC transporter ATP-binding protein [Spirochaetales bacterium]HRY54195.1 ABC transporter ATP-binding protein [Spirochaetia bacterium]HRZ64831.1 ABC transporter ATP-binding protein [Spirochaetia bacterium]